MQNPDFTLDTKPFQKSLLGDSVSPWNTLFGDCFLSELVLKCMNILFNLVLLGVDESMDVLMSGWGGIFYIFCCSLYICIFFRKRLSMDVSMSRCGLPTGLVWLSFYFLSKPVIFGSFVLKTGFWKSFNSISLKKTSSNLFFRRMWPLFPFPIS